MKPTETALTLAMYAESISPQLVEEIGDELMYLGYCLPTCTGTDCAQWLIKRILKTKDSDGITVRQSILYANGVRRFDQAWDNRAQLSYRLTANAEPQELPQEDEEDEEEGGEGA